MKKISKLTEMAMQAIALAGILAAAMLQTYWPLLISIAAAAVLCAVSAWQLPKPNDRIER